MHRHRTGPETVAPTVTETSPVPAGCTFDRGMLDPGIRQPGLDSCYFTNHTPTEYLDDLRTHPGRAVTVTGVLGDWITLHDAGLLMQQIDSGEPAAPVVSPMSSYWPSNQTSTVGNEALFLVEGYRTGRYPPVPGSLYYFRPNRTEVRTWWDTYGKQGLPDEKAAVRAIQEANPDLFAYPSDAFPMKAIITHQAPDGWYVAFVVEGSGVPIISARCYSVGNDRSVRLTANISHSIMVLPQDFSPETCG